MLKPYMKYLWWKQNKNSNVLKEEKQTNVKK